MKDPVFISPCDAQGPEISLNHYQQLMLRLNTLAPYNAVHSVLINPQQTTLPVLENSINAIVNQLLPGEPEFSPDFERVRFKPPANPVRLENSRLSLEEHTEQEMAYSFLTNEFPLRFFIIQDQAECYFSITYNHWIADAYAIFGLIDAIFTHIRQAEPTMLTLHIPKMTNCFQHIYRYSSFYYRYLGVLQSLIQFSRAFRTELADIRDTRSGCRAYFFEKDCLQQLLGICKAQQITLNDLFVTVLAIIFGRITREKRNKIKQKFLKPRRDRILIAVISNIRAQSRFSLANAFGLFLGFFYLSFKSPENLGFNTLSKLVCADTRRLKRKNAAIKQYLLFKVQKNIWDKTRKIASKYRLFSKNTPITAGISNMNMTQHQEHLSESIEQYIRFSPTAMVCPVVFNITTFNGYLSLGINYRKTCYTAEEAEAIKDAFIHEINQLVRTSTR